MNDMSTIYKRKPAFVAELLAHLAYVIIFTSLACILSLALPAIFLKQTLIYSALGCFPWILLSILLGVIAVKPEDWHTATFDFGEGSEHLLWMPMVPPAIMALLVLMSGVSLAEAVIIFVSGYVFGLGSILLATGSIKMRLAYSLSTKLGFDRSSTNIT